jgi:hypothetical protein
MSKVYALQPLSGGRKLCEAVARPLLQCSWYRRSTQASCFARAAIRLQQGVHRSHAVQVLHSAAACRMGGLAV